MWCALYEIQKPQIKNKNKALPPSLPVTVIYVKEENTPKGIEGIEWLRKLRFRDDQ
jgi:hypothetical protein